MDAGVSTFLVSTARALLYVLLAFVIVGQLGVNTASIVTLLGTAGIAIGMSLQGSLANVAGGILILLMKPFRVGDYVSTSYGDGTVKLIGLVYTVITTVDNRALTIPNGALSNSAVFNANAMPERRLDISVGISYDSDIALAKQIMEDVYRDCPGFIPDRDLNVHVSGLEDSSVTIEGFGWVRGSEFLKSKWYVLEEVKLRYDAAGVTIPFPQVDVHLDPS
jgi:small conductance mechanosensitive channel